jgi:hypothetical protein
LAPLQFSCWWAVGGVGNKVATWNLGRLALAQAAGTGQVTDALLRECVYLARGVLGGEIRDIVRGATHYLTYELYHRKPPDWAQQARVVAEIGAHVCLVGI